MDRILWTAEGPGDEQPTDLLCQVAKVLDCGDQVEFVRAVIGVVEPRLATMSMDNQLGKRGYTSGILLVHRADDDHLRAFLMSLTFHETVHAEKWLGLPIIAWTGDKVGRVVPATVVVPYP